MNVKLRVLTAGALFFTGQMAFAQKASSDSATKETKIEEVVVVAYKKQKPEAVVGAVSTVDSKVLKNQQATSVLSSLQGTVSGVNVIASGGSPGDNPSIFIRGIGSINSSTQPLIILDGVPFNGNINTIPQDHIESITTLKDAGSAALYGSRASSGVILITTKSGRNNRKPSVNLTSLIGVSTPSVKMHERMGAEDFMKYSWQAIKNRELYAAGSTLTEQQAGQNASNRLISELGYNPYNVANPIDANGNVVTGAQLMWDTDWEKAMINSAAFKQEHRVDISGGDNKTTYFFAADYLKMDGAVRTSDFERTGVRLNIDSKPKDWLKAGLRAAYNASSQNYPTQSGSTYNSVIGWINGVANIYPIYKRDANGGFVLDELGEKIYDYGTTRPVYSNGNALGTLFYDKDTYKRYSTIINGYAEATLARGLSLKSQLGYEHYTNDRYSYVNNEYGDAASVKGRVRQDRRFSKTINFTNIANYDRKFGNHGINLQGIFEVYQYTGDVFAAQGTGFLPNVYVLSGSTKPESVTGYINRERMVSYLGRVGYEYGNKYFIEGTFRRDGSSRFSEATRWGDFFSVGGSWVISRENFLKDSKVINNLKLRGSYGELGNNQVQDANGNALYFPYLQSYITGYNQLDQTGVVLGSIRDANLSWEKTAASNIGLDFGLFNNRLSGSVEYFSKESIDLIYAKPVPGSTGNTSMTTNVGAIKNYGWEVNLNSVNIQSEKFSWRTNLNLSFIKNKLTELTQESYITGTKRWEVGRSIYDFYIPVWAGVDPADGMGMWRTRTVDALGNVVYGTTKSYTEANANHREYVGSALPDVTGGLTNTFQIGNLDLNVLVNFSFGGYIYDSSYAGLMRGFSSAGAQQSVDTKNAWQKPGDITDTPINIMRQNNNSDTSTRFLFKNDYVRLKAITLGYTIPKDMIEPLGLDNFRVFVQADNVWTYQTHKGIDPEQSIGGTTDNRSYPLRTISLGVNVNF